MKIGLSIYSLLGAIRAGMSVERAIEWMGENGAEHVELVDFVLEADKAPALEERILDAARRAGLTISSYCMAGDVLDKDPAAYEAEINRLMRGVDRAHRMGIAVIRHDLASYARTNEQNVIENFDRDLPTLVDACRRVADYAAAYGITTTVENHGRYINGGDRVRRLVLAVDRPNFKCTMDIGNCLCVDEDPEVLIRALMPLAAMVHFKDFYIRRDRDLVGDGGWIETTHGRCLRGAIVGHGDVDVRGAMRLIREAGYDGCVSIEFEGLEDCLTGSRIGLENLKRLATQIN